MQDLLKNKVQILLDVKEEEAPIPLQKAMQKLPLLDDSNYIKFIHRIKPMLLLDYLNKNGFSYIEEKDSDEYILYIYKG
ncbi:MAG: hypothetical protein GX118_07660 [Arcobacter butzleri]|jgi:hypothetical protein|nr:hypothetical protein [Arcobacteraceae bacterium]MDY0365690.1 hypothetical protein [Arcobacteraceae bacterium]NLO18050.1 hypothetical protein [Aliarcobacter butzleri]